MRKKKRKPHASSSSSNMSSWITRLWVLRQEIESLGTWRVCSQECRGGARRRKLLGRGDSLWPYNFRQQENIPLSPYILVPLMQVQQTRFYWPALLWFKFQTAHGFIPPPPPPHNHPWELTIYGFYRPRRPWLNTLDLHNLCMRKKAVDANWINCNWP